MCGLVGTFGSVPGRSRGARALAALSHRGPDGHAEWRASRVWLGHALLAITDTPSMARQPMLSAPGDVALVFNGEVFNSEPVRALCRAAGHIFERSCDTETILAAYMCFGSRGLAMVQGIFAVAICDLRHGDPELWLMRDPVGIKPLYLLDRGADGIAFASELGALRALTPTASRIDRNSLAMLISTGAVPQPATIQEATTALPPGRLLRFTAQTASGRLRREEFQPTPAYFHGAAATGLEFPQALSLSVAAQVADRECMHLFLGGGVDSAMLGALAAAQGRRVHAHTLSLVEDSPALDETAAAAGIAASMGWRHHVHPVQTNRVLELVEAFVRRIDQPTIDGFNNFLIAQAIAGTTRVAYSGTGPDEMLFGYTWAAELLELHAGRHPSREALAWDWVVRTTIIADEITSRLCQIPATEIAERRLASVAAADPGPDWALADRLRLICLSRFTGDRLLRDLDVTGMAAGLEVRVPWLDARTLEAAWAIGGDLLMAGDSGLYGGVKSPFVRAAAPLLPKSFLAAGRKHGFILPYERWLRGPLQGRFADAFASRSQDLFDTDVLSERWRRFCSGAPLSLEIWLLGIALLWRETLHA